MKKFFSLPTKISVFDKVTNIFQKFNNLQISEKFLPVEETIFKSFVIF